MSITRKEFMDFFRNEEQLNTLSVDDRIEVFQTILLGSSDITRELLNDLLYIYSVDGIQIIGDNKENKKHEIL